ncbi:MAG TPA: hypothetical protein IAC31_02265, partial [Candidatus Faecousia intestinigallinarum]|nr:hypothetical protein [Candidatus Faecousia intestinigallinarum]
MEEVQRLQEEAGYPGLLVCMDQGYTEILNGLNSYEGVSSNALYIGVAAYAVVMVLFLVLFPFQQRRTLATMASLGANPHKQVQHILISALGILIPGSILGGLAGALVWEQVAARLMASVNVNIPLEANMLRTAPVLTLSHLILMSLLTLLTAIPLTANKNLMRRK